MPCESVRLWTWVRDLRSGFCPFGKGRLPASPCPRWPPQLSRETEMDRLRFRGRERGRQGAWESRFAGAGRLVLDWGQPQEQRHRGESVQSPGGRVGVRGERAWAGQMTGSLSTPHGTEKSWPTGRALKKWELAWKGNLSQEVGKGPCHCSVHLPTALIEDLLLSPAGAPAAPTAALGQLPGRLSGGSRRNWRE